MRGVVSTCGGSTRCGKGTRFLSVFFSTGKGFTKLKLAERALSISEQIIPSRPVLGLFLGGHPQSAYHTKFFCLNIQLITCQGRPGFLCIRYSGAF